MTNGAEAEKQMYRSSESEHDRLSTIGKFGTNASLDVVVLTRSIINAGAFKFIDNHTQALRSQIRVFFFSVQSCFFFA